jgi:hypothetical protein
MPRPNAASVRNLHGEALGVARPRRSPEDKRFLVSEERARTQRRGGPAKLPNAEPCRAYTRDTDDGKWRCKEGLTHLPIGQDEDS